jgi:serine protease Do
MTSRRVVELFQAEAFARAAVEAQEREDTASVMETIALAHLAADRLEPDERDDALTFVAWAEATAEDTEGALATAFGIADDEKRNLALMWIAATFDAQGDRNAARRAFAPLRVDAQTGSAEHPFGDGHLWEIMIGWLWARVEGAQPALDWARGLEAAEARSSGELGVAAALIEAGDEEGARRTLSGVPDALIEALADGSSSHSELAPVLAWLQSLAGDLPAVHEWVGRLPRFSARAAMLAFAAVGQAARGDVDGAAEAASAARSAFSRRATLGLNAEWVTYDLAEQRGLPAAGGALVADVAEGGPAAAAGIRPGDVILAFNGRAILKSSDLAKVVAATPAHTVAEIRIWRDGQARTITLEMGEAQDGVEVLGIDVRGLALGVEVLGIDVRGLALTAEVIALARAGRTPEALERAAQIGPDERRRGISALLAAVLAETGDRAGAARAAQIGLGALNDETGGPTVYATERAILFAIAGDAERALEALPASAKDGLTGVPEVFRGWAFALTGDVPALVSGICQIMATLENSLFVVRPDLPIARAQLLAASGDAQAARAAAKTITDEYARTDMLARAVASQASAGDSETVVRALERLEDGGILDPEEQDRAFRKIASALAEAGDFAVAIASARRIDGASDRASALRELGVAQAEAGDRQAAGRSLSEALAAAQRIDDAWWRTWALEKIAAAQAKAGEFAAALATARQIDDASDRASALRELGVAQAESGDRQAAARSLSEALGAALRIDDARWRASALGKLGVAQAKAGAGPAAARSFSEALAAAGRIDDASKLASALRELGVAQAKAGDFAAALATARRIDDALERTWALVDIVAAQAEAGDFAAALATARQIDDALGRTGALWEIAAAQAEADDRQAAARSLSEALGAALRIDDALERTWVLVDIVAAQAEAGDFAAALATARRIDDAWERASVLWKIAVAQAVTHDVSGVRETLQAYLDAAMAVRNPFLRVRALSRVKELELRAGDEDALRRMVSRALGDAGSLTDASLRAEAFILVGGAQAALGEKGAAHQSLAWALEAAQAEAAHYYRAHALVDIAEARAGLGDDEAAKLLAARAFEAALLLPKEQ